MIPRKLQVRGFLSYLDKIELDFTGFDLACITGANGAGKSSLLDAITWCLFGQARRRDDSLINSHADSAEVALEFEYEGNIYRIRRGKQRDKTAILEFTILNSQGDWKPLTEHSLRETESQIQHTLRMDYETFINASFFLQGKADQFSQHKPAERKQILSSIFGLEIWEEYRAKAFEKRKQLETKLAGIDSIIKDIQAELEQENDRRKKLEELEQNLQQTSSIRQAHEVSLISLRKLSASLDEQKRLLDIFNAQVETAQQRVSTTQAQLEDQQQQATAFHRQIKSANAIETAYQQWQTAREELGNWELLANNFRQYEVQRSEPLMEIERERTRLEQELLQLQKQNDQVETARSQLDGLEKQLTIEIQQLDILSKHIDRQAALEQELKDIVEKLSTLVAENKQLYTNMHDLRARIGQLTIAEGAVCPLCGQDLTLDERQTLVNGLEEQGKDYKNLYLSNQDQQKQSETTRQQIEKELATIKRVENNFRQQQRLIDQLNDRHDQIRTLITAWQTDKAPRLQELTRIIQENDYAQAERSTLSDIDDMLKKLGYDTTAHEAARSAEQIGRSSEQQLRLLETARAALAPLSQSIDKLTHQQSQQTEELYKVEEIYHQAKVRYEQEICTIPDVRKIEEELYSLQEQENRLRMQVGAANQTIEVLKTQRTRLQELNQQRLEQTRQIAQFRSLERAFSKDGVPALLIEQALPEIEAQANEILDRLTGSTMSVSFNTQKNFKDKNREDKKETLDIMISDSAGLREYELFSGGEAFRVNFAIRLALSHVLAKRAGAKLQTLVIDEGFGSQDAEGRQRLIETINLVRPDFAKILVITHLEDLKEAFSARIEVEKKADGSSLRVIL